MLSISSTVNWQRNGEKQDFNVLMNSFYFFLCKMNMVWVCYFFNWLKSHNRYSKDVIYNNFPFPEAPEAVAMQAVEAAAQGVLEVRDECRFDKSSRFNLISELRHSNPTIKNKLQ